ncbi:MAG: TonB family protein [Rhodocyclaceae bacterium]|nr:TonB family protein [Rhodocyclaceae bacterium]
MSTLATAAPLPSSWDPSTTGWRALSALLASLLIHGALLLALPDRHGPARPHDHPLMAFIVASPAPAPPPDFPVPPPVVEVPPPVFSPAPPEPLVQPPPETVPTPTPTPKPTPKLKPQTKPNPRPAPAPTPEHVVGLPAPIPGPQPQSAPPPVPVVAAPPPPPPPPDPRLLERYGDELSRRFARSQTYPRLAQLRGWQGEVLLQLTVAATGDLLSVRILRSSGHEVLDRHAIALVEGSGTLPRPPAGFDKDDLRITVPVRYRLGSG